MLFHFTKYISKKEHPMSIVSRWSFQDMARPCATKSQHRYTTDIHALEEINNCQIGKRRNKLKEEHGSKIISFNYYIAKGDQTTLLGNIIY
jgi:hypothetical protein